MLENLTQYPDKVLNAAILDINKSLDKEITISLNEFKVVANKNINSLEREKLRDYIYYTLLFKIDNINNNVEIEELNLFQEICSKHMPKSLIDERIKESRIYLETRMKQFSNNKDSIISSLTTRIENLTLLSDNIDVDYSDFISSYEKDSQQLYIYNMKPSADPSVSFQSIINFLNEIYDDLLNYHYAAIIFQDTGGNKYSWDTIAKTAIYAENFKSSKDFPPFKKRVVKQKETLLNFIENNSNLSIDDSNIENIKDIVADYYDEQSYGFLFTDLFISEKMNEKVLILQKIEYDPKNIPCPDCLDNNARGNSYSKIMFKSFECSNPNCKSRSKSGRGKRYNYLSSKLNNKKIFTNKNDEIPRDLYKKFRRDIYESSDNIIEDVISLYSYSNDRVIIYTHDKFENTIRGRNILTKNKLMTSDSSPFSSIRISELLKKLKNYIKTSERTTFIEQNEDIIIKNAESSSYLSELYPGQYSYAITSPPYYNAREYSQWPNLTCYLIDMMINSHNVINSISTSGTYLYNIGDIVDQDNVYIPSMMSKRRQILGLYSVLIFELVGWNTNGNIVWDKGEVQSKRNSTSDILPYYVKPINCYEHIWIFTREKKAKQYQKLERFSPVIKMGRDGKNSAKHTAPYPLELVELLDDFIDKEGRILDPFLGSGTTALWSLRNKKQCLGLELNKEYFELSLERLKDDYYNISLF